MVVCSVFDSASAEFGNPAVFANRVVAERQFAIICSKMDEAMLPDVSLYYIGDFAPDTGVITPVAPVVWKRGVVNG